MVSRQQKLLRQKAVARAEKYKDDQIKKLEKHAPSRHADGTVVPLVSPPHASGTAIDGRKHTDKAVTGSHSKPSTSTVSRPSLVTAKQPLNKALAGRKKAHHVPIFPAKQCSSLTKAKRCERLLKTNTLTDASSDSVTSLPSSPSGLIAGNELPLDTDSTIAALDATASPSVNMVPTTLNRPLRGQNQSGGCAPRSVPISPLLSTANFTFSSPRHEVCCPEPPTPLEFCAAPLQSAKLAHLFTPPTSPSLTIFDTLEKRATIKSPDKTSGLSPKPIVNEQFVSTADSAQTSSDRDESPDTLAILVHGALTTASSLAVPPGLIGPWAETKNWPSNCVIGLEALCCLFSSQHSNSISRKLMDWVKKETTYLQQLEANCVARVASCQPHILPDETQALVLYRMPLGPETKLICPTKEECSSKSLVETWESHRMFFADVGGHTRLVNLTQTLYQIDITMDDGASDFDSIASPMKLRASPAPLPVFYGSQSSSEEYPELDLEELEQFDCMVVTDHTYTDATGLPSTSAWSIVDDEDIIDPCLFFKESVTTALMSEKKDFKEDKSLSTFHNGQPSEHEIADTASFQTVACNGSDIPTQRFQSKEMARDTLSHASTKRSQIYDLELPADEEQSMSPFALIDTSSLIHVDTAYSSPSYRGDSNMPTEMLASNTNTSRTIEDKKAHAAFSSDWASELTRLTPGTESLFTYLDILETDGTGSVTKTALVAAFLHLINNERERLGRSKLPKSYTPSSVAASRIIPHTIFLGTASLSSFLSHFEFGADGKATVDQVYRAFKSMQAEDLYLQMKAATGIMGALGRVLG
ncbi:hypothetical protein FB567DRAFT_582084 [Paraphoma chrysanthemicola]|uniref:Uncharacterized protein n=1 Tax=Paraphoma chrysanthemicola TaxID=798071 RepID=A0A8K0R196_9PLEO|nr:hypothetical protein FB567DRAFT_582084 [Paraphoma chrysanthemicola]